MDGNRIRAATVDLAQSWDGIRDRLFEPDHGLRLAQPDGNRGSAAVRSYPREKPERRVLETAYHHTTVQQAVETFARSLRQ